jgi:hypothetical protein
MDDFRSLSDLAGSYQTVPECQGVGSMGAACARTDQLLPKFRLDMMEDIL